MSMWSLFEKKGIQKILKRAPSEVVKSYEAWKRILELQGPSGLKLIKGFHDEALKGEWKGFRSSRLNKQWRVIYKVEIDYLEIFIIEITPS